MPPLTAPELELWERRFSRSLEDLEPLHLSDGQYARRETKVRQARVRKQRLARECTTPKHALARARAARTAHATDKTKLLEVLASDCGCVLREKGCFNALFERYGMSVIDDIIRWRSRSLTSQQDAKTTLKTISESLRTDAGEFVPRFPPIQSGMELAFAVGPVPRSGGCCILQLVQKLAGKKMAIFSIFATSAARAPVWER